jgi:hypothetical protein
MNTPNREYTESEKSQIKSLLSHFEEFTEQSTNDNKEELPASSCSACASPDVQELSVVVEQGIRYLKFSGIYNVKYPLEDFQCKFMGAVLTAIYKEKIYRVMPLFSSVAQPSDQIEF